MHIPPIAAVDSSDPEIARLIHDEARRQYEKARLIPSENYVSVAVLEASGSVLTNKYSEGYPGRRYYEGQQFIDPVEIIARDRAKALFGVDHANVQPYSGSPANLAVYLAFAQPGDTVMGMALPMGGHLTHGWSVSATGKWFRPVQYGVRHDTGRVDMDEVRDLALKEQPKIIFCGGTAIPRTIDFPAFAAIAAEAGAGPTPGESTSTRCGTWRWRNGRRSFSAVVRRSRGRSTSRPSPPSPPRRARSWWPTSRTSPA